MPVPAGRTLPDKLLVGIRPEDISARSRRASSAARVALTEPLGVETIVHIQSGEQMLLSLVPGMTHSAASATPCSFNILARAVAFLRRGWQADRMMDYE